MTDCLTDDGRLIDILSFCLRVEGTPAQRLGAVLDYVRQQQLRDASDLLLVDGAIEQENRQISTWVVSHSLRKPSDRSRYEFVSQGPYGQRLSEEFESVASILSEAHLRAEACYVCRRLPLLGVDVTVWRDEFFEPASLEDLWTSKLLVNEGKRLVSCYVPWDKGAAELPDDHLRLLAELPRLLYPTLMASQQPRAQVSQASGLSPAQAEVFKQAVTGQTEKHIARQLHRSHHTVHSHLKAIYRHFGVSSRAELLALVLDGEISPD